jgi:hypothetical protein
MATEPLSPALRMASSKPRWGNLLYVRRSEKRPADVTGNAVKVMRIAIGEEAEELETDRAKNAAAELGSRGGKAQTERMAPERRTEIARQAAQKR